MAHVRFENVDFCYPVFELTGRSLKVSLTKQFVGSKIQSDRGFVEVKALSDVSFALQEGDRVGLVGRNGAGKSSLLRLVAKVAHPTAGRVSIKGRIVPLIERGLGVNWELSGRKNIELPMRLLGATSKEVKLAMEEIPEWTGLGQFIDLPMRTYSEGMKARLLFAICTAINADILVLDEWLGAGDANFVQKAEERMQNMVASANILVLASHSNDLITRMCNKAIWMDGGNLIMFGDSHSVIHAYMSAQAYPVAAE